VPGLGRKWQRAIAAGSVTCWSGPRRRETPGTAPGRGLCLEPHDCVLAKLAAGRDKDYAFAAALANAGLIDVQVLASRLPTLPADPQVVQRIEPWISSRDAG
jgi:hypothetical protein